jgi:hypothetical protein
LVSGPRRKIMVGLRKMLGGTAYFTGCDYLKININHCRL